MSESLGEGKPETIRSTSEAVNAARDIAEGEIPADMLNTIRENISEFGFAITTFATTEKHGRQVLEAIGEKVGESGFGSDIDPSQLWDQLQQFIQDPDPETVKKVGLVGLGVIGFSTLWTLLGKRNKDYDDGPSHSSTKTGMGGHRRRYF